MERIVSLIVGVLLLWQLSAQVQYPHIFNPAGSILNDTEKPCRDVLCLNGSWQWKRVMLHFEAIAGFAKIYVNGKLAGENLDIFFATRFDVTYLLKEGTNDIRISNATTQLKSYLQARYNYLDREFNKW